MRSVVVTGTSTADLVVVLVDARNGITEQTRRHASIASLLRVPHLVICVNKMDLVDYDEDCYIDIREEFRDFAKDLDVDAIAPQVEGKFASAFIRARKPRQG